MTQMFTFYEAINLDGIVKGWLTIMPDPWINSSTGFDPASITH
jgi:hypothetical protein